MMAAAGARSAGAEQAVIRMDQVGMTYPNGVVALAGLDLSVGRGEIVTLLGPSGCGKSTALRIMAGLATPTSGTVGLVPAGADDAQAVGFVFQEPTLMPWGTVFENVWLPLRLKGRSRRDAREIVGQALELVGLAPFASAQPRELSGGMKMRVSIARALVTGARVMLMDEPFAALDEITRWRLNDDLRDLRDRLGWTVVFVTHSVAESVYLSDRVLVMAARPGRVVAQFRIDADGARGDAFRASAVYARTCVEVSAALRAAIEPA
jgi:NitT/TauT family transport system ATP-binding protein